MKASRVVIISILVLQSFTAFAQEGTGLQLSASGDIVGQANLKEGSGSTDSLMIRGAEFMLYAPVDHYFDGTLSWATHTEAGIQRTELHEAWIGSTKLIPRSRFRLGQFFLGIGRLNQFHQHDWPFISAPKVHQTFFAFEGVLDTGAEYSYLLPTPFFLEVTTGLTNGFIFGHEHTAGTRPYFPTHYLRAATYVSLFSDGGAQIAFNYLGRRDSTDTNMTLLGIDLTAKWKEAKTTLFMLQSEFWYRIQSPNGQPTSNEFGFYLYPQYNFAEELFLGLRIDYFSELTRTDSFLANVKNFGLAFVPTISYQPSEFATFRLAYNFRPEYERDGFRTTEHALEAQAIFIIGAHPAHDF